MLDLDSETGILLPPLQYFTRTGQLSKQYYWLGVQRYSMSSPYQTFDSLLPQAPSEEPYAHWHWGHPKTSQLARFDCVSAQSVLAYDKYLGDTSADKLASQGSYQVPGQAPKFGWGAYNCSVALPFMCSIPADSYVCQPPPPPRLAAAALQSPAPPRPPRPPAPVTGE